jgi:hypothetical protein
MNTGAQTPHTSRPWLPACPPAPPQGDALAQPLPLLYAAWLPPSAAPINEAHIAVPLYASPGRGAVLAEAQLPAAAPGGGGGAAEWALVGVALVVQPAA